MMSVFGLERANLLKLLLVATVALVAACLLALVGTEKPAGAAFPGANGKISFTDGADIWVMNADGGGQTRLTNTPGPGREDANWSPDGTKIVFQHLGDIWVMNADGSGQTNLTNTPSDGEQHATYSPDGTKIVFSSFVDEHEIHVMNADGSGRTVLANIAGDLYPAWSPDGDKIAFQSFRDGNFDIYVMNADGTNQTNLTNTPFLRDERPDWSPDGTKIAFHSDPDGNLEIYSMNADGTNQTNLTNTVGADASPAWSPDGTKIAFSSTRDGDDNLEIYSMNADGTNQTNLTNNPATHEAQPDWQPLSDTTPPTLNIPTTVTKVTTSASGTTVNYTAAATDDVDGSVPINCSPASGSLFPIGTTQVNCSAIDAAGNQASGAFHVKVVYDFGSGSGGSFGEPVRDTELNQLVAGGGVPIRFALGADYGLNIFAAGYPKSKPITCTAGLPPDQVEEIVAVSKSGLTYDATSGLYTYVWKTDRAWKGTCRELNVKLADGTDHLVKFQFK